MDKNLEFLKNVSNEELGVLVDIIKDKGKLTEKLTKSYEYKKFGDNYKCYVETISDEYLQFGTNTFKNFISGRKNYKEVLCDVAKDMKVEFDKSSSVELIENLLLEKWILKLWKDLSDDNKAEMIKELYPNRATLSSKELKDSTWILELFKKNDMDTYKLILLIENHITVSTLGRNLKTAFKFALTRIIFGPISWLYAIHSIAGPAYRVIAPCTILLAAMRIRLDLENKLNIKEC